MPTQKEIDSRNELLKEIKEEVLNLKDSPLYKERIVNNVFPVIGEGNHFAQIMFIGEAPGKNEAATGKPFCGKSGKILDELLESVGINRADVYVTNVVKDRPPLNRDPQPSEIEIYSPFLDRQIEIIRPKVIATLGRFSMSYIMNKYGLGESLKTISLIHGKVFDAKTSYDHVKVVPLYHPAVAVYNANMKGELKKDFQIMKDIITEN